jgi:UDP-N-acetylmuramate--alanine ligase
MVVADQSQLAAVLMSVLEDGDILLMQGAGDIGRIASELANSPTLEALL